MDIHWINTINLINMKQDFKCFFGNHKYEVYKEENVTLAGTEIVTGKIIISRCTNCGKIKTENIELKSYCY